MSDPSDDGPARLRVVASITPTPPTRGSTDDREVRFMVPAEHAHAFAADIRPSTLLRRIVRTLIEGDDNWEASQLLAVVLPWSFVLDNVRDQLGQSK